MIKQIFALLILLLGSSSCQNMDCALIVPQNPLTAQGLSTPYQLVALNPSNGACSMANPNQVSFVQGAVLDLDTGELFVYNPLVTDHGILPLIPPVIPNLPAHHIVGLWFGTNAGTLTLLDSQGSLTAGNCTNGLPNDIFGQFAYCNAPRFFEAANNLIQQGKIQVPAKGFGLDGLRCPTVRSFSIVDQDPSDNVITTYLVSGGRTAQNTLANRRALPAGTLETNGSDNRLLTVVDSSLGCNPWKAPDLADNLTLIPALPLNELHAAAKQAAPVALVPAGDPMTLTNGQINLQKLNLYRVGVNQPAAGTLGDASTIDFCKNLFKVGSSALLLGRPFTVLANSPDLNVAPNLFDFLTARFSTTIGPNGLNCTGIIDLLSL